MQRNDKEAETKKSTFRKIFNNFDIIRLFCIIYRFVIIYLVILRGKRMSTVDLIGRKVKKNISEIQGLAETVMNAPESTNLNLQELYEAAADQPTVVVTDTPLPEAKTLGLEDAKVLVSMTGEDVDSANWAVKIVPEIEDACLNPSLADEREELLRIVRQATYDLVQREIVCHSSYLTENNEFNCKFDYAAPAMFAKMVFDTALHYYPIDEKSEKEYAKSKKIDMPSIRIVCYPDWVNEEWLYWKSRSDEDDYENEPPRIMMIYDIETNTAFLLGAKSFVEVEKAVKVLAWNTAINVRDALPVNGAAKTITITKSGKKRETTFLTVSNVDSERSFFGLNAHNGDLKAKTEEIVSSVDSGLVMITDIQGRKKSLVSLGKNFYGTVETALSRQKGTVKILAGENIVVTKDAKEERSCVLSTALSPSGKVHVPFSQEEKDLSLPEYLVMIVKDDILPPVTLVKNADVAASAWFTYVTSCPTCSGSSVIPGGNPCAVWSVEKEMEMFDKAAKKAKFKMLILNSGAFSGSGEPTDIGDEILLSTYVKIARAEMKWKELKLMPGFFVPEKNTFKSIKKNYDTIFDYKKLETDEVFIDLLRDSVEQKVEYLRSLDAPSALIAPFYKILTKLM